MRRKPVRRKTKEQILDQYGTSSCFLGDINNYQKDVKVRTLSFFVPATSRAERLWETNGKELIQDLYSEKIIFTGREWLSFSLPGSSYTADYYYLLDNGKWVIVEIKASKCQAGYRDARTKLRCAASLNPWFDFYEAMLKGAGFEIEKIQPEASLINHLIELERKQHDEFN